MEQSEPFRPTFQYGEMLEAIEVLGTVAQPLFCVLTTYGKEFTCKAVVIAAGGGSFQPKKPPIAGDRGL